MGRPRLFFSELVMPQVKNETSILYYLEQDQDTMFFCIVNSKTSDTIEQYVEEVTATNRLKELNHV